MRGGGGGGGVGAGCVRASSHGIVSLVCTSAERNPPIDEVIAAGAVPLLVQALVAADVHLQVWVGATQSVMKAIPLLLCA